MNEEILVYKTMYSTSYRCGDIFRKYFNNPIPEYIEREIFYSRIAYNNGIPTPKYLGYGFSPQYGKPYVEYEYIDLETFLEKNKKTSINIEDIIAIADKMNHIIPSNIDNFWNDNRMIDFHKTLLIANKLLSGYTERDMQVLKKLPCNNIIHGDLTETNVCFYNKNIYFVDFEIACIGPKIWDKCYFFASAFTKEIPEGINNLITEEELKIIQIIAKIRYGRAVRKNLRIDERENCCKIWLSI